MSDVTPERPDQSEPVTGPVMTAPPAAAVPPWPPAAPPAYVQPQPSKLNKAAAWVGIVAGSLFVVVVIFGAGVLVGKGLDGGGPGPHRGPMMVHGGPAGFPMGPPRGGFDRGPDFAGPFGPGGPMIDAPRSPNQPAPTAQPRP